MKRIVYIFIFLLVIAELRSEQSEPAYYLDINQSNYCDKLQEFTNQVAIHSSYPMQKVKKIVNENLQSEKLKSCTAYPELLTIYGFQKYVQNDIFSSRIILLKADSLYKAMQSDKEGFFIRNNIFLSLSYSIEQEHVKALNHLNIALSVSEQNNLESFKPDILQNIGLIHLETGDLIEAKKTFEEVIHICTHNGQDEILGFAYQNLSRVFHENGKFEKALSLIFRAENIFEKRRESHNLYNIEIIKAGIYQNLGDTSLALLSLNRSLDFSEEMDKKNMNGLIYFRIAGLTPLEDKESSIEYYEKALSHSNTLRDSDFRNVVLNLKTYYIESENLQKLSLMIDKLTDLYNMRSEMLALELNESINKESYLKTEQFKNTQLNIQKKNQSRVIWIISLAGLISILLGAYAFNQLRLNSQLNEKIKDQNLQLESQNEELKNFAYVASHDLKAPSRSILNFTQLLRRKLEGLKNDEAVEYLDFIESSAEGMNSLVNNLLEFATIKNNENVFEDCDLQKILKQNQNDLNSLIEERNAIVNLPEKFPDHFIADREKMKILFQNLMNNALKFVPASEKPILEIGYEPTREFHRISIKDNGIGIEAKYLDKIFSMFQKLHSTYEYEGTGIGLSTCKKIADLHRGKIEVESEIGSGSTFTVFIPRGLQA